VKNNLTKKLFLDDNEFDDNRYHEISKQVCMIFRWKGWLKRD